MRFCKKCGTLYLDSLDACPKCNAKALEEKQQEEEKEAPKADPATVKRQWAAILIGIPALIALYWLIGYVMKLIRG